MKPSRITICCLAFLGLVIQPAFGSSENNYLFSPETIGKVALLPFGNLTETDVKYQVIADQVQFALENLNIDFVPADDLRTVLRKHRIRSRGKLSPHDAMLINEELDVNLILIGSIDLIRDVEIPEFSLSLRLITPDNITIRSAVSISASGRDYTKLFDVGTIEETNHLIEVVAADAVKQLFERLLNPARGKSGSDRRWAVLAFDNSSKNRWAGQIMVNWLISYLVTSGYQIAEPGTINRLFQPYGGSPVGGIDLKRANLVKDSLDIYYIITGEIDTFNPASGILDNSKPELTFGARVCDSQSGLVVTSFESETDGDQFVTVFGMGRYHSIGKLAPRIFEKMQESFEKGIVNYGVRSK